MIGSFAVACGHAGVEPGRTAVPPVPRTLADGRAPAVLPAAVRTYRGRPVLGARAVTARASALRVCPPDASLRSPALVGAWVSTEGLAVGYATAGAPPLWACDAVRVRERLRACARAASPSRAPERVAAAGGAVGLCGPRRVAFMWVAVPASAAWALVDHDSYWLAYRAPSTRLLRISGTKGVGTEGFRARVAFLAAGGRRVREESIAGFVAG